MPRFLAAAGAGPARRSSARARPRFFGARRCARRFFAAERVLVGGYGRPWRLGCRLRRLSSAGAARVRTARPSSDSETTSVRLGRARRCESGATPWSSRKAFTGPKDFQVAAPPASPGTCRASFSRARRCSVPRPHRLEDRVDPAGRVRVLRRRRPPATRSRSSMRVPSGLCRGLIRLRRPMFMTELAETVSAILGR